MRFSKFLKLVENEMPFDKDPKIGWWKDQGDHYTMYHGTHKKNVAGIMKSGIKAPSSGSTKGWVSMTHDPYTAHAYASMHGGESAFRGAKDRAETTPHKDRRVMVAHIPKDWAHANMNQQMRGNVGTAQHHLSDRSKYDSHKASGKTDHEYYQTTELRFKQHVPAEFIKGYMQKVKD